MSDPAEEGGSQGSIISLSGTLSRGSPCSLKSHVLHPVFQILPLGVGKCPSLRTFRDSLLRQNKNAPFSTSRRAHDPSPHPFFAGGPPAPPATAPGAQQSRWLREGPTFRARNHVSFPARVSPRNTAKPVTALRGPMPRCDDPILV